MLYFSPSFILLCLLFCFLQSMTATFHLPSVFAGVTEQCCLLLSVLQKVVLCSEKIWERKKGWAVYGGGKTGHLAAAYGFAGE